MEDRNSKAVNEYIDKLADPKYLHSETDRLSDEVVRQYSERKIEELRKEIREYNEQSPLPDDVLEKYLRKLVREFLKQVYSTSISRPMLPINKSKSFKILIKETEKGLKRWKKELKRLRAIEKRNGELLRHFVDTGQIVMIGGKPGKNASELDKKLYELECRLAEDRKKLGMANG